MELLNGGRPYRDTQELMAEARMLTVPEGTSEVQPVVGEWLRTKLRSVYVGDCKARVHEV